MSFDAQVTGEAFPDKCSGMFVPNGTLVEQLRNEYTRRLLPCQAVVEEKNVGWPIRRARKLILIVRGERRLGTVQISKIEESDV